LASLTRTKLEHLLAHAIDHRITADPLDQAIPTLQIEVRLDHELDTILSDDDLVSIVEATSEKGIDNRTVSSLPNGTPLLLEFDVPTGPDFFVFRSKNDWVLETLRGNRTIPPENIYLADERCYGDADLLSRLRLANERFHILVQILDDVRSYPIDDGWLIVNKSPIIIERSFPDSLIETIVTGNIEDPSPLLDFVEREDHQEQRLAILSGVLERFLEHEPVGHRLSYLVERIEIVTMSCRSTFELYLDKFSYDRLRHDIHSSNLEIVASLNRTLTDLRSQVVVMGTFAIALSQFSAGAWIQNAFTLAAILIGTILYTVILSSQTESIEDIRDRIERAETDLRTRQKDLFEREFKADFGRLSERAEAQRKRVGLFQFALWLTFAVAVALFLVVSTQQPASPSDRPPAESELGSRLYGPETPPPSITTPISRCRPLSHGYIARSLALALRSSDVPV
jgi:hypothetical protein